MLIGIDFDNTIVCYDQLFHALALEAGLIPADLPATKTAVRNHMIAAGREDEWTELQGRAYGPEIHRAEVFPGVIEFLRQFHHRGAGITIISHKTPHAVRGPKYDLHASALEFLHRYGFFDGPTGLTEARVFFEPTKRDKLARIGREGCTDFIDDLADVLDDAEFPPNVRKWLFGDRPDDSVAEPRNWLPSWLHASARMGGMSIDAPGARPEPRWDHVVRILQSAGLPNDDYAIEPLVGGRNNRTYVLTTSDRRRYLLKWYFYNHLDERDRLEAEYASSLFCRRFSINAAPAPLARDDSARLGLYEYFERDGSSPVEAAREHVGQALEFVRAWQRYRTTPEALALRSASEACFSLKDHRDCVGRRLSRLSDASLGRGANPRFVEFINRVGPVWQTIAARLEAEGASSFENALDLVDRCVSPSDFGFHNALVAVDGRLRFFDFEYAGWDDPAKLLCDFFCQVEVPVPLEFAPWFATSLAADYANPAEFLARAELLFPAYRLKWCAIVLNDFLLPGAARRSFGHAPPSPERLAAQLAKAETMLDRLIADGDKPIFTATTP